jgi:flagellar basal-body rod modification protein FlgD
MSTTVTQGPIGPAAPSTPTATTTGKGKSALGKDDFLKLLVTQLQHQDPMNPSSPEEFSAQLAQFSSLESMQNIEQILQQQADAGSLATLTTKADLGASFIGRQVIAAGNQMEVTTDGTPASATVDVGTGGGQATLTVYDGSGEKVSTQDLGWQAAGRHSFKTGDLPAGKYTYEVTVTGASGADVPVQTYTSGIVDGVSFINGTVVLRSGSLNFPIDNVVEVERAPAGASILAAVTGARVLPSTTESVQP